MSTEDTMKKPGSNDSTPVSRKGRREVERELGVYIDNAVAPKRSSHEQYGIYDEDEKHVGDIIADSQNFTVDELTAKVKALFKSNKASSLKWAIEFRNGSFLQTLEANIGGSVETAMPFDSKEATEAFMDQNQWIYVNGGMAKEVKSTN